MTPRLPHTHNTRCVKIHLGTIVRSPTQTGCKGQAIPASRSYQARRCIGSQTRANPRAQRSPHNPGAPASPLSDSLLLPPLMGSPAQGSPRIQPAPPNQLSYPCSEERPGSQAVQHKSQDQLRPARNPPLGVRVSDSLRKVTMMLLHMSHSGEEEFTHGQATATLWNSVLKSVIQMIGPTEQSLKSSDVSRE